MTFAEFGQARGISKASAARLVRSKRWRRQTDNQGHVRVLVPPDAIGGRAEGPRADVSRLVNTLEAAIAASGERAAADATTIATLQTYLASERDRAAAQQSRADALADRLGVLQAALDQVRAAQEAEAAERRARGVPARLRAAWRGE